MALDRGHAIEIRARIAQVFDGVTRLVGGIARAGYPVRSLDAEHAKPAITLSIRVPDGTDLAILAARLARHPAVVEAQAGVSPA